VLETAIRVLDAEGPDALTYRRLAAELDTGVGTLYWHVENKDALMTLVLDVVLREIGDAFDDDVSDTWDGRLRAAMLALWTALRRHPWAAQVAITSGERSPNLLRFWDRCAALLFATGLSTEEVAYALATLRTFVIGNSTQNAVWHVYGTEEQGAETLAAQNARTLFEDLPAQTYPAFARLVPVLSAHSERTQFLHGLDLILRGLGLREE
jgi:AcrR family transcriptional regulator